jgi:hypothetical protein
MIFFCTCTSTCSTPVPAFIPNLVPMTIQRISSSLFTCAPADRAADAGGGRLHRDAGDLRGAQVRLGSDPVAQLGTPLQPDGILSLSHVSASFLLQIVNISLRSR